MLRNLFDKDRPRTIVAGDSRCDQFQPRLLSYVDHELNADERQFMENHLRLCAECRAELGSFQQAEALLGAAASSIPSAGDLRPAFYARLEQSRRRSPANRWVVAVPAIACAAMAFFFGICEVAAWAGIHRSHQHEARRERQGRGSPRYGHLPFFHRLAQHF